MTLNKCLQIARKNFFTVLSSGAMIKWSLNSHISPSISGVNSIWQSLHSPCSPSALHPAIWSFEPYASANAPRDIFAAASRNTGKQLPAVEQHLSNGYSTIFRKHQHSNQLSVSIASFIISGDSRYLWNAQIIADCYLVTQIIFWYSPPCSNVFEEYDCYLGPTTKFVYI